MNKYFQLASADLVVPNQDGTSIPSCNKSSSHAPLVIPAWGLLWDFTTLRELVDTLPGNTALQNRALAVANEIMNVFHKGDLSDIRRARTLAEDIFGRGWEAKGADIYTEGAHKAQIIGCGNCHVRTIMSRTRDDTNVLSPQIDTAWCVPHKFSE